MVNRRTFAVLAAIGAIAAANLVSACVKSDDQDSFSTPTLPPAPTPQPLHHCQVVWASQNASDPAGSDVLVLDGSSSLWINGPANLVSAATLATNEAAGFRYLFLSDFVFAAGASLQPDLSAATAFSIGGTGDNFTISGLTVNGTQAGQPVMIADPALHKLFGLDTSGMPDVTMAKIGSAGNATFDGNFSDYSGTTVDIGTGTAHVGVAGTPPETLGSFGTWAACYDIAQ